MAAASSDERDHAESKISVQNDKIRVIIANLPCGIQYRAIIVSEPNSPDAITIPLRKMFLGVFVRDNCYVTVVYSSGNVDSREFNLWESLDRTVSEIIRIVEADDADTSVPISNMLYGRIDFSKYVNSQLCKDCDAKHAESDAGEAKHTETKHTEPSQLDLDRKRILKRRKTCVELSRFYGQQEDPVFPRVAQIYKIIGMLPPNLQRRVIIADHADIRTQFHIPISDTYISVFIQYSHTYETYIPSGEYGYEDFNVKFPGSMREVAKEIIRVTNLADAESPIPLEVHDRLAEFNANVPEYLREEDLAFPRVAQLYKIIGMLPQNLQQRVIVSNDPTVHPQFQIPLRGCFISVFISSHKIYETYIPNHTYGYEDGDVKFPGSMRNVVKEIIRVTDLDAASRV